MKYQGEELVRVRSESELRPGMTVWLLGCANCSRTHVYLVTSNRGPSVVVPGWALWATVPKPNHGDLIVFWKCISEGRLYRLRDEAPAEQQTTATKRRERV